jgi:hypothetical protein
VFKCRREVNDRTQPLAEAKSNGQVLRAKIMVIFELGAA